MFDLVDEEFEEDQQLPELQARIGNIIPQEISQKELATKPIFDNKYYLLGTLGRKDNLKVYLCQSI